jgi:hypothetical protein
MNKKEVSELKKNISKESDLLTINQVVMAFVDAEKEIKCKTNRSFIEIPDEELECIVSTMTKGLGGVLGKTLVEYEFPRDAYEEEHAQSILYNAYETKLKDEEAVDKLLEHIVSKMQQASTYAITIVHSSYTVFKKNKTDDENPYDDYDYSFLSICVSPVEIRVDGLVYNEEENAIVRKLDYDRIVADKPTEAVLYPTFTGRGPDVNHVLVYNKNVKKPNISLVEEVLECQFTSTATDQKIAFHEILEEVVGDDLDYQLISTVNERIRDIIDVSKNDFDIPTIGENDVCNILIDSGIEPQKEQAIRTAYQQAVGDEVLPAVNLLENKMQLTADGISITIGKNAVDKVRTKNEDGHRYLLIDLDDPTIEINGMESKI